MHLTSGPALSASAETHIGFADLVTGATITGWAIDLQSVSTPPVLRASIDGAVIEQVRCILPRDDVRAAGIPSDVGGFRYVIPGDFMDGRQHVLRLDLPSGAAISFPAADGSLRGQHAFRVPRADAASGCVDMLDVLHEHGIRSAAFVAHFDIGDYVALNGGAALSTTAQCVGHFARFGRAALCPIAAEWRFEPDFYAEIAPDAARLTPAAAYLHWLNAGLPEGVRPNRSQFLKSLGLTRLDAMPAGFDAALYRALNPDATGGGRWDALRHAIDHGIPGRRDGLPPASASADMYLAAADRLAVAGRPEAARPVYETVLAAAPAHPAGLQHYADCLLRLGDAYGAEQVYLRVLAAGADNVWTDLNLAKCRRASGRIAEAARGLARLRARLPGDVAIAAEARADAGAAFRDLRDQARRRAALGFIGDGRTLMAQAATILTECSQPRPDTGPRRAGAIRAVALVADMSLPQCRAYRVEQKAEHLAAGGFTVQVFDAARELDAFAAAIPFLDAVIFYRIAASPEAVHAIQAARAAGAVTFYDIDDAVFDGAHFPDSLASYGGLVSAEEYGDLATGVELFGAAMSLCEYRPGLYRGAGRADAAACPQRPRVRPRQRARRGAPSPCRAVGSPTRQTDGADLLRQRHPRRKRGFRPAGGAGAGPAAAGARGGGRTGHHGPPLVAGLPRPARGAHPPA